MVRLKRKLSLLFLIPLVVTCVSHDLNSPLIDCKVSGPGLELGTVTNATSCSATDGNIQVIASGGKQPYTYLLNGEVYPSEDFANLAAGIYAVGVRDANGCDSIISNISILADGLSFEATVDDDNLCQGGDGSILIEVSEGSPPYTYKIDGGTFTDNNEFTGLAKGNHRVEVKDNNNCTISLNVTVPHGFTGTRWQTEIKPIIETYCATTGCHNGVSREDLRHYDKAKFFAFKIKQYTQDRSMPFDGPSLSQFQIDLIACWVDDGALEN